MLQNTLAAKPVQDAIQSTLQNFALKQNAAIMTNTLTAKEQDLLNAIIAASGWKGRRRGHRPDQEFAGIQEARKGDSGLSGRRKIQPHGRVVHNNQAVVYVTGIALVVGGVVALYATKTGGTVLNAAVA